MGKSSYRSTFAYVADAVSGWLVKASIALFVLLILMQFLMQDDTVRYWISETYRLEGVPAD